MRPGFPVWEATEVSAWGAPLPYQAGQWRGALLKASPELWWKASPVGVLVPDPAVERGEAVRQVLLLFLEGALHLKAFFQGGRKLMQWGLPGNFRQALPCRPVRAVWEPLSMQEQALSSQRRPAEGGFRPAAREVTAWPVALLREKPLAWKGAERQLRICRLSLLRLQVALLWWERAMALPSPVVPRVAALSQKAADILGYRVLPAAWPRLRSLSRVREEAFLFLLELVALDLVPPREKVVYRLLPAAAHWWRVERFRRPQFVPLLALALLASFPGGGTWRRRPDVCFVPPEGPVEAYLAVARTAPPEQEKLGLAPWQWPGRQSTPLLQQNHCRRRKPG